MTAKPKSTKPKAPGSSSGMQQPWQTRPAASSTASYGSGAAGTQKKCESAVQAQWGGGGGVV